MNALSAVEYGALLRSDLSSFIQKSFSELHARGDFLHNWHLDLMADRLAGVMEGRIKRLIITVPPRSLKSICVSVGFVAWVLGHYPTREIICVSYGQDLADKHARDTRQVMQSKWYKEIFATRLSSDRVAIHDMRTTQQGGRLATSVGGGADRSWRGHPDRG